MKVITRLKNQIAVLLTALTILTGMSIWSTPEVLAVSSASSYNSHEKPIVDALRARFDGSLAESVVGRAIWYMEYGYIVYGHSKYATTGYCDCSQFVSMVYKDFGYSITSASRNYDQLGVKVSGVSVKNGKLTGVDKLKPGDIFTFWKSDGYGERHIGHVAIYMGQVNGKPCIIGTCSGRPTAIGIINSFSSWYGDHLYQVRRVLPAKAYTTGGKVNAKGPVIPDRYQMPVTKKIVMPKNLAAGF
jgi:hypothetical protein